MNLEEILERVESLDGFTPKSKLLEVLEKYPDLKKNLVKQLSLDINKEWIEKAKKEKPFFLIYNDSWKGYLSYYPNSIQLKFIGTQNVPTISIDIHQKPV